MRKATVAFLMMGLSVSCSSFASPIQEVEREMQAAMKDQKTLEFRLMKLITNTAGQQHICGEVRVIEANGTQREFVPFSYADRRVIYLYSDLSKSERSDYRLSGCEGKEQESAWRSSLTMLDANCSASWKTLATYYIEDKSEDESVQAGLKVLHNLHMSPQSGNESSMDDYLHNVLDMARDTPDMEQSIKTNPEEARNALMSLCRMNFIEKSFD